MDLLRISTDDSLVLNFGKDVECTLLLRPCKVLFVSLAAQTKSSSLEFECLPFYPTL